MEVSRRQLLTAVAATLAGCSTNLRVKSSPVAPTGLVTALSATITTVPTRSIEVIERAAWGAADPAPGMVEHVINRLTIHHSAAELTDNRLAPDQLRAHQEFHQTDRGWPDLAYHFAIDLIGNIYEGRPLSFRGDTATTYDPTGHLLVVFEGNFDEQPLESDQQSSAVNLLAWAAAVYNVDPSEIGGHRDYADTSCPGDAVYSWIASGDLGRAVQESIDKGVPELVYLRGQTALERVAEIEG